MKILEYHALSPADRARFTEQIDRGDWSAAHYLARRLREGTLRALCGPDAEVLLLAEGGELLAFCTLSDNDEIDAPELTPWIGFVYTFPAHRGRRHSGRLIAYALKKARRAGHAYAYLSSDEVGLYEKYGFVPFRRMATVWGHESQVYRRALDDIAP